MTNRSKVLETMLVITAGLLACTGLAGASLLDDAREAARLLKERRFACGETVILEGSGGAAVYLIASGEATVSHDGIEVSRLGPGDHFGELGLVGSGLRMEDKGKDIVC